MRRARPLQSAPPRAPARALGLGLVLGALAGCGERPATTGIGEASVGLSEMYVLSAVSGGALPARIVSFSANVYRVHADTLRFDLRASTYTESAMIGGRDTTSVADERVSLREAGPIPYEQRDVSTIMLWNFMGLGRADAKIHDGGLTVTSLGQRFAYLRVVP